jgi:hypothetical protein
MRLKFFTLASTTAAGHCRIEGIIRLMPLSTFCWGQSQT